MRSRRSPRFFPVSKLEHRQKFMARARLHTGLEWESQEDRRSIFACAGKFPSRRPDRR
jgi:hypothetical protein